MSVLFTDLCSNGDGTSSPCSTDPGAKCPQIPAGLPCKTKGDLLHFSYTRQILQTVIIVFVVQINADLQSIPVERQKLQRHRSVLLTRTLTMAHVQALLLMTPAQPKVTPVTIAAFSAAPHCCE